MKHIQDVHRRICTVQSFVKKNQKLYYFLVHCRTVSIFNWYSHNSFFLFMSELTFCHPAILCKFTVHCSFMFKLASYLFVGAFLIVIKEVTGFYLRLTMILKMLSQLPFENKFMFTNFIFIFLTLCSATMCISS